MHLPSTDLTSGLVRLAEFDLQATCVLNHLGPSLLRFLVTAPQQRTSKGTCLSYFVHLVSYRAL